MASTSTKPQASAGNGNGARTAKSHTINLGCFDMIHFPLKDYINENNGRPLKLKAIVVTEPIKKHAREDEILQFFDNTQPSDTVAYIAEVEPGGIADQLGIQVNDIIINFASKPITLASTEQLKANLASGKPFALVVLRPRTAEMTPQPPVAASPTYSSSSDEDTTATCETDKSHCSTKKPSVQTNDTANPPPLDPAVVDPVPTARVQKAVPSRENKPPNTDKGTAKNTEQSTYRALGEGSDKDKKSAAALPNEKTANHSRCQAQLAAESKSSDTTTPHDGVQQSIRSTAQNEFNDDAKADQRNGGCRVDNGDKSDETSYPCIDENTHETHSNESPNTSAKSKDKLVVRTQTEKSPSSGRLGVDSTTVNTNTSKMKSYNEDKNPETGKMNAPTVRTPNESKLDERAVVDCTTTDTSESSKDAIPMEITVNDDDTSVLVLDAPSTEKATTEKETPKIHLGEKDDNFGGHDDDCDEDDSVMEVWESPIKSATAATDDDSVEVLETPPISKPSGKTDNSRVTNDNAAKKASSDALPGTEKNAKLSDMKKSQQSIVTPPVKEQDPGDREETISNTAARNLDSLLLLAKRDTKNKLPKFSLPEQVERLSTPLDTRKPTPGNHGRDPPMKCANAQAQPDEEDSKGDLDTFPSNRERKLPHDPFGKKARAWEDDEDSTGRRTLHPRKKSKTVSETPSPSSKPIVRAGRVRSEGHRDYLAFVGRRQREFFNADREGRQLIIEDILQSFTFMGANDKPMGTEAAKAKIQKCIRDRRLHSKRNRNFRGGTAVVLPRSASRGVMRGRDSDDEDQSEDDSEVEEDQDEDEDGSENDDEDGSENDDEEEEDGGKSGQPGNDSQDVKENTDKCFPELGSQNLKQLISSIFWRDADDEYSCLTRLESLLQDKERMEGLLFEGVNQDAITMIQYNSFRVQAMGWLILVANVKHIFFPRNVVERSLVGLGVGPLMVQSLQACCTSPEMDILIYICSVLFVPSPALLDSFASHEGAASALCAAMKPVARQVSMLACQTWLQLLQQVASNLGNRGKRRLVEEGVLSAIGLVKWRSKNDADLQKLADQALMKCFFW